MGREKLRRLATGLLAVCIVLLLVASNTPVNADPKAIAGSGSPENPFRSAPLLLGAHRGGKDLWPENTLVAFTEAARRWPEILLECDVTASLDGYAVVIHDDTVDRTTDGRGFVDRMTLSELKALDAAYHFSLDRGNTYPYRGKGVTLSTLEEVLHAAPQHRFLIEMKESPGIAQGTAKAITAAGAEHRCIVAAIRPSLLQEFKRLQPRVATCYDYVDAAAMMHALRGREWEHYEPAHLMLAMSPSLKRQFNLSHEELAAIRAKGILACFFTVNDTAVMRQLLELGADSILSDKPDLLEQVIREHAEHNRSSSR